MRWWHGHPWRFDRGPFPGGFWLPVFLPSVIWILIVVLAILLVVWVVRTLARPSTQPHRAREILDERYARGELSREQYLAMRRDLELPRTP